MKVALVCSWLNQYGGAERVLEVLKEMYPQAPIYTSIFWPEVMPRQYRNWDVRTSFMNVLPLARKHHQAFLPLYPFAFESFDLSDYDVVISNSSAFCQGVRAGPDTAHVCYCLTPARFLWDYDQYITKERVGRVFRAFLPLVIGSLRGWDARAAQRVSHFVAISRVVADRIQRSYRREAAVIYPSIDTTAFKPSDQIDDYFLIVSRLIPYKQIDLAVEAFNLTGLPLKIVGDGRFRPALEAMARPNVEFLGRVSDAESKALYSRCRALIFPGEEDFGLTPVEAQASGRPVIAFGRGGALETVVEGEVAPPIRQARPEALAEALQRFDHKRYDPAKIRRNAARFDVTSFKEQFSRYVVEAWEGHKGQGGRMRT
ncbi:MAG: glycosyltransferase [Chloroflexi bacterium]|nr:glycosyltransferase [Chloroflexota bacterium]